MLRRMIQHRRITLRHVSESDLPQVARSLSDPQAIGEFNPLRQASPQAARKRFELDGYSSEEHELLVVCDESQAVIGQVIHFTTRRYSTARELGWMIYDPAHRGRGYAGEAVQALVDHLFRSRPLHRLECCVNHANLASQKVALRAGFVREGRARGLVFIDGRHQDSEVYGLLRPEWEARTGRGERNGSDQPRDTKAS
jgi:RimJ/RimL family protein N-acetyltransferase